MCLFSVCYLFYTFSPLFHKTYAKTVIYLIQNNPLLCKNNFKDIPQFK